MRSARTTFIWLSMLATTAALAALIGYEKASAASPQMITSAPATQPVVVTWRYEAINTMEIAKELDPHAELGGVMTGWHSIPSPTSDAERAQAEAKAKAEREQNFDRARVLYNRVIDATNKRSAEGWELCAPPKDAIPTGAGSGEIFDLVSPRGERMI